MLRQEWLMKLRDSSLLFFAISNNSQAFLQPAHPSSRSIVSFATLKICRRFRRFCFGMRNQCTGGADRGILGWSCCCISHIIKCCGCGRVQGNQEGQQCVFLSHNSSSACHACNVHPYSSLSLPAGLPLCRFTFIITLVKCHCNTLSCATT